MTNHRWYRIRALLSAALLALPAACGPTDQAPTAPIEAAAPPALAATTGADLKGEMVFEHRTGGTRSGIAVPATGASDDGRTFRGTLTVTGAGFDPQIGPVLFLRLHGALMPRSSDPDATPSESVSLSFGPVELGYTEMKADEDCIQLEIQPPAEVDPATKTTVQFDVSTLTMATLPGPANLLADLICANDRAIAAGWSVEQSNPVQ